MTRAAEDAKKELLDCFCARFATGRQAACDLVFASAPGRVELAGNHTDHQGGLAIAAAIDRRAWGLSALNGTDEIHVLMDGFGEARFRIDELEAREDERGTSVSLIRGMAHAYVCSGKVLRGFDMAVCSDVPVGSGVSSSAAFEMLVGISIRALCGGPDEAVADSTALALDGVQAEREHFGKPCGAQDQLASATGGIVAMDFSDEVPKLFPIDFDASSSGYALCLIDTRCDHSEHIDEYAAIAHDMVAVARLFGCARLRDVGYETFLDRLSEIRADLGDRRALRALHYFEETRRVRKQEQALRSDDFVSFLELARMSGASSAQYLQNVSPASDGSGKRQPAMIVLALCAHLLGDRGAWRIHGGGFGGSVLCFVPLDEADSFTSSMNNLLGYSACSLVSISPQGAQTKRLF